MEEPYLSALTNRPPLPAPDSLQRSQQSARYNVPQALGPFVGGVDVRVGLDPDDEDEQEHESQGKRQTSAVHCSANQQTRIFST